MTTYIEKCILDATNEALPMIVQDRAHRALEMAAYDQGETDQRYREGLGLSEHKEVLSQSDNKLLNEYLSSH